MTIMYMRALKYKVIQYKSVNFMNFVPSELSFIKSRFPEFTISESLVMPTDMFKKHLWWDFILKKFKV